MGRTARHLAAAASAAFLPLHAAAGQAACRLCAPDDGDIPQRAPIALSIESGLNFSRMALVKPGDGEAEIDPLTGRKITRSNLVDLGGTAFSGRARITGEPFRPVRIDLPRTVILFSPGGARAELTDFVTDLPGRPVLGADGTLEFTFGGRLRTTGGGTGNFRGRIPISVDYD